MTPGSEYVTFERSESGTLFAKFPIRALEATLTVGRDRAGRWQPVEIEFPGSVGKQPLGSIGGTIAQEVTAGLSSLADAWEAEHAVLRRVPTQVAA